MLKSFSLSLAALGLLLTNHAAYAQTAPVPLEQLQLQTLSLTNVDTVLELSNLFEPFDTSIGSLLSVDATIDVSFSEEISCPVGSLCLGGIVFGASGRGALSPIQAFFFTSSPPIPGGSSSIISSSSIGQLSGSEGLDLSTLEGSFSLTPPAFENTFPEGGNALNIFGSGICEPLTAAVNQDICDPDDEYPLDMFNLGLTLTYRYETVQQPVATPEPSILLGFVAGAGLIVAAAGKKL
ncbi:hypothetical protein C7271_06535 [filamentous cyanobacterium CCP5]|nr:hypothetical protein C7271_06535 [filamentous cyanobacterium CCP5]